MPANTLAADRPLPSTQKKDECKCFIPQTTRELRMPQDPKRPNWTLAGWAGAKPVWRWLKRPGKPGRRRRLYFRMTAVIPEPHAGGPSEDMGADMGCAMGAGLPPTAKVP